MRWGPHRRLSLKVMMRRSVRLASRPGLWWGRQGRSSMGWPSRYRPTHRLAVGGRDLESCSHPAHGPAFFHHQMSNTTTPLRGQRCVSVGHEGLRSAMRVCQPTSCRRPSHNLTPVHNLPRKYN